MATKSKDKAGGALVIVESPSKAKTINKYLGSDYTVMASMGHVRDLPESGIGVDFERSFEPTYEVLPDKRRTVGELRKASSRAGEVYLATDLDREGEAIAWHLAQALDLPPERAHRVVFNEITKSAIQSAFSRPNRINMDKVNAQQARRILDRIVGYQLSPLLQSKIGKNLSAGRVQSVAVRVIVEREREIRSFVPEESWRIFACFATDPGRAAALAAEWRTFFQRGPGQEGPKAAERNEWLSKHGCLYAELIKLNGAEVKLENRAAAQRVAEALGVVVAEVREEVWEEYARHGLKRMEIVGGLDAARAPRYVLSEIQTRRTLSRPGPPFITASLQQAASTLLGFSPSRTMRVAQALYEGVELGEEGQVALITYMRTDSTHLSGESVSAARSLIEKSFGSRYLPEKPNHYGSGKRAQEAHEAIRPTEAARTPESLKSRLPRDHWRLYDLIWRRFIACQMTPAEWDSTTVLITASTAVGEALFRTSGRRLIFDGHQRVYNLTQAEDVLLPPIEKGTGVVVLDTQARQEFSAPPPRYTEASLIKKLEAEGIGRPSTYAAIIQTVLDRGYVELRDKRLYATDKGEIVTDKLVAHFPDIMDVKFTSYMEDELDKVEEAHLDWIHVLNEFYGPFKRSLDKAHVEMDRVRSEPSEYTCTECGKPMVYRWGRNGRFLACSGYPECKASSNIDRDGKPVAEPVVDVSCPVCGKGMQLRTSRLGPFLGCTGYPECASTMPCDDTGNPLRKVKPEEIHEKCAECRSPMQVKFARGKAFLGCSAYPKCKATAPIPAGLFVEKPPAEEAGVRCDKCGRPMVIRSSRRGPFLSCSGFPRCRNAHPMEKLEMLRQMEAEGKIPEAPELTPPGGTKGRKSAAKRTGSASTSKAVDPGPPPPGFAWTRTGRPVVETWPESALVCPECGGEVVLRSGRFGPFFACSAGRKCSFIANLRGEAKKRAEEEMPQPVRPKPIPTEISCEECGALMWIREGRTGKFLGCSAYPKCKATQPLPEGKSVEELTAASASR